VYERVVDAMGQEWTIILAAVVIVGVMYLASARSW
jgi:hypothetical protein